MDIESFWRKKEDTPFDRAAQICMQPIIDECKERKIYFDAGDELRRAFNETYIPYAVLKSEEEYVKYLVRRIKEHNVDVSPEIIEEIRKLHSTMATLRCNKLI